MKELSIPFIDVAALFDNNQKTRATADRMITRACETVGAFVAIGLPAGLRPDKTQVDTLFRLFSLPEAALQDIAVASTRPDSDRVYLGYGRGRNNPTHYFDMGPEYVPEHPPIKEIEAVIETNQWPDELDLPGWKDDMIRYFNAMESFGKMLIASVARSLGFDEKAALNRYEGGNSVLRLLHYLNNTDTAPSLEENEKKIIFPEHTDNRGFALFWQDTRGVEIKTPEGDWVIMPDLQEGLLVHVGEALETQTARRFTATPHRVIEQKAARYSLSFFLEPGLFASIKPFASVGEEDPPVHIEDTFATSLARTLRKFGRS